MEKVSIKSFVTEAFDYLEILKECSKDMSVNRYLLEYIANGFVKFGRSSEAFINNVDEWLRMLVNVFPEVGFNHDTHQVVATIDLTDQLVIIDEELCNTLDYIITIQEKYGLLISYSSKKNNLNKTTQLSKFFEYIEDKYPLIEDRFKGLGSSSAIISKEVIMDPATRRIISVTANDVDAMIKMGVLLGDGKDNVSTRKELMMNFEFTKDMIDN